MITPSLYGYTNYYDLCCYFVLICKSIDFCCCMLLVHYLSVIVCFPIMQDSIKLFGHIARAAASEDHSRAQRATSIHRSPPCCLAPRKRPTSSVLASNNRERSQTDQPWTSLCITASNGSSFPATHRGNGYALRACHQMMR